MGLLAIAGIAMVSCSADDETAQGNKNVQLDGGPGGSGGTSGGGGTIPPPPPPGP